MDDIINKSNTNKSTNVVTNLQVPEISVIYAKYSDVHPPQPTKTCNFCKNNKEAVWFYSNHTVKTCPIIKNCRCSICGETGHTMGHCIKNPSKASITRLIGIFNSGPK